MGDIAAVQDKDKKLLDTYKGMSVGEILWRTRQSKDMSVIHVAEILKIRVTYLEALEKDDVSVLPGRVYAIGFVRSYADFLKLDGDKLVYLFKNQKVGHEKDTDYRMPMPLDDSQLPGWKILLGCFLVLIIGGSFLFNKNDQTAEEFIIPDAPTKLVQEGKNLPEKKYKTKKKKKIQVQGIIGTVYEGVEIRATFESWVSLRDGQGVTIAAKLMKSGDYIQVPLDKVARMNTGNIGGLEVYLAGKKIALKGELGEVRKNVDLSIEHLKSLQSTAEKAN